jgi:hypothetical protein
MQRLWTRCRHCLARRSPWVQHEWACEDTVLVGALSEIVEAMGFGALSARRRHLSLCSLLRMAWLQKQS